MHTITFLLAFSAAKVFGLQAPIEGYRVKDFVWAVDPFNNGTTVHIPGTVQDVYREILKINPGFSLNLTTAHDTTASKRDGNVDGDNLECGPGPFHWHGAVKDLAQPVIDYLRKIPGQPGAGPGPGECGRVSCDYAAIWWCNDNTYSFSLPSFNTIADCAQVIYDACGYRDPLSMQSSERVVGQQFHHEGWNCILREDTHCK